MQLYQLFLIASMYWHAQANAGDKNFAKVMSFVYLLASVIVWGLEK
jgi:hypothetical protein